MNAERLLEVYEQISEAPDAIARLRRFVLDLAVRGKLVEPISAEGSGAELARQIKDDKAQKEKAGLIKPAKTPKGATRDTFLEIPDHWQPLLMVDVLDELQTGPFGSSLKKSDYAVGGVPVINPASIVNEAIRPVAEMAVGAQTLERLASFKLQRGDIVMARRGEMGRCAVVGDSEAGWLCGTGSLILRPSKLLFAQYLVLLIGSPYSRNYLSGSAVGATMQNLNQNILLSMPIGLPPEPEQHRIVAKVDELMALCDRLEEARETREAVRDKLTAASLTRLTAPDTTRAEAEPGKVGTGFPSGSATTEDDFPAHANFALEALPALTTRPGQIKTLRQTILNLAVRGKLVEQDSTDEPASELLARMMKERKEIVARRKIRGATPPKAPSADIEGFTLPVSWELCALGQITLITDPNPSHRYPDYSGGTVPILSTREFAGEDGWNPETAKLTTKAFWEFQKEICDFAEGDIIFARKGRLGLPRFLPPFAKFTFSHTLFSIKPMKELDPNYLLLLLRREEVVEWLTNEMNQNTGVPTLGKAKTERLPIPLPPLAEQHRIVAKVDALMALCDRLESALTTTDTTRTRLLEALLNEALESSQNVMEAAE